MIKEDAKYCLSDGWISAFRSVFIAFDLIVCATWDLHCRKCWNVSSCLQQVLCSILGQGKRFRDIILDYFISSNIVGLERVLVQNISPVDT